MSEVKGTVPDRPVDIDEVIRRFPALRQSTLSSFDDCELSALFEMRYERGWNTHPQARGTVFHRVAAECLRLMREQDSQFVPVAVALAILEDCLYQHGVPAEDVVRVPLRELPMLEMAVRKFARDNRFPNIRNVMDVERRLSVPITYQAADGSLVERVLTGMPDALIAAPVDEVIVLDWKDTWSLPPARDEDADDPGISYHGFFQQQFYAWLIMRTYDAVQAVTLREFYVRRTQARPARVTRQDLPRVEQRLRFLVASFDRAVAAGQPANLRMETLEALGAWKPSPGKHCDWCHKAHLCPIDDDYKGSVTNPEQASLVAAIRQKAMAVAKQCKSRLDPYVTEHGAVDVKWAKGRLVYGPRTLASGRTRIEQFAPSGADRPVATPVTENLEDAMRQAAARARAEREARAA